MTRVPDGIVHANFTTVYCLTVRRFHLFYLSGSKKLTEGAPSPMDPKLLQGKVQAFAQRLLEEANGDPVRALGLLVLVLDGADLESADHAQRLVVEVRKVLMPETVAEIRKPIQHLAGEVSWEGVQHCLRCAKVLARNCHERGTALATGYIYEIGPRFTSEDCDDFDSCI